jgi:hypothetical protein
MRIPNVGIAFVVVLSSFVSAAQAWNNTGHMVVARLAWLHLSPDEQQKVSAILKKHPHYGEFLKAGRPQNVDLNQWVFLKAATWPDWVKSHHTAEYAHNTWHFIDFPFVPPGSHVSPPGVPAENAVKTLNDLTAEFKDGEDDDTAIALCWFLHLIGDIHQPLHCVTMYSEDFPNGDRGGNRCLVMMGNHKVQLHKFWDGLLGSSTKPSAVFGMAEEVTTLAGKQSDAINADLNAHKTFDSWAQEGFANAKKFAYLDGTLKPANSDDDPAEDEIPDAPHTYQTNAGEIARVSVAKAGLRLASTIQKVIQ